MSVVKPPKLKSNTVLDFVCDRIRPEEWKPLLNALEKDTSLHVIAIRSRMHCQFLHDIDTLDKLLRMKRRFGSLWTSYMLTAVLKSICRTIRESSVLSSLEFDGLPITLDYMHPLLVSLSKNNTLKMISFQNCPIEDEGCRQLCLALRFQPNVEVINLSGCGLTSSSGEYIASVIKFQRINRYCECWHKSLRYEDPNVENMGGLKRISLNCNPNFGDDGLVSMLDELDDDLWIKAIDMQRCGITENMTKRILDLVEYSRSLEVVDFRGNERLSARTIERILEIINRKHPAGYEAEYQWCVTATSIQYENSSSRISSHLGIAGIQKSRSVPFGRVTSPRSALALRRTITSTNIKKRSNVRDTYSKKTIDQAKMDIMELNKRLQEEIAKREEAQHENEILVKRLAAIRSAGVIDLRSKDKEEINVVNKSKSVVSHCRKINGTQQLKNGVIDAKKRKVLFSPTAQEEAKTILENLLYKDGVVQEDDLEVKGYFEENIKSSSKVALYLDTTDKKTFEEMSVSNISLIKFIEEMNNTHEDDFGPDSSRGNKQTKTAPTKPKKVKNGMWHPGAASRTMIKVR